MATNKWNEPTKLVCIWAACDVLYFSSSVLCFIFSLFWRGLGPVGNKADGRLLRRFVIREIDAIAAVCLGSVIFVQTILALVAFLLARRKSGSTRPLTLFNWSLAIVLQATVAIGTSIWFWSLRQVEKYAALFTGLAPAVQSFIQEELRCCGYFNATTEGIFTPSSGFCSTESINSRNTTIACVVPLTAYSDSTLNSIFTTVYGIAAVQCALFLATASLRVGNIEDERFRRIDEKRANRTSLGSNAPVGC